MEARRRLNDDDYCSEMSDTQKNGWHFSAPPIVNLIHLIKNLFQRLRYHQLLRRYHIQIHGYRLK